MAKKKNSKKKKQKGLIQNQPAKSSSASSNPAFAPKQTPIQPATSKQEAQDDMPYEIRSWLKERKKHYKKVKGLPVQPDLINNYWKISAPYFNKSYIQRIHNERLRYAIVQVEKDLDWLGIPFGNIALIEVQTSFHTIYGRASKISPDKFRHFDAAPLYERILNHWHTGIGWIPYVQDTPLTKMDTRHFYPCKIEVSSLLLDPSVPMESLYETLVHEYLHTVPGGNGHGKPWSYNANICSQAFDIDVTRTSSFEKAGVEDQIEENARYIIECESCKQRTYRFRTSNLVLHPEQYRCSCGGKLKLIKGKEYLPKQDPAFWQPPKSQPSSFSKKAGITNLYPYVLECTSCHKQFGRQRMSQTIQHPENYRCSCGGRLQRIK